MYRANTDPQVGGHTEHPEFYQQIKFILCMFVIWIARAARQTQVLPYLRQLVSGGLKVSL